MSDVPRSTEIDAVVSTLTSERSRRDLSMREVARGAGVSPSCVHSWEHGTRAPSLDNLRAWARTLGYDLTLTRVTPPEALCAACGKSAPAEGSVMCTRCRYSL